MRFFSLFLFLSFAFWACEGDRRPRLVAVFSTDLFEAPSPTSRKIAAVEKGSTLFDLGQPSPAFSKIEFGGRLFEEPFALVSNEKGQNGWIFGGAVRAKKAPASWQRRLRFESFFGKSLFRSKNVFENAVEKAATEADVFAAFEKCRSLRDSLAAVFEKKATDQPAAFFWSDGEMPFFVAQRRADERGFSLFFDFGKWAEKAAASPDPGDDAFFKIWLLAFAADSIESDFPAWRMPLDEARSCSNLGSGAHLQTFEMMANSLKISELCASEIELLKSRLLADISSPDEKYWQNGERILAELDAILARDWPFLTEKERTEIELRRAMFAAAAANGLRLNLRSGEAF